MTGNQSINLSADDLFDIVCLCHAALAQDSPETPEFYINQILNYTFGYLKPDDRKNLETYLAEKKYLPPAPKIEIAK
jgi:hypothetical protein